MNMTTHGRNITILKSALLMVTTLMIYHFGSFKVNLNNTQIKQRTNKNTTGKRLHASKTTKSSKQSKTSKTSERSKAWTPFNETNPHKTSWCPSATCHNSPICAPCNRRYLFVLATPRSGSTTILTTLNALPGVRLSGENPDVFVNFWKLTGGHVKGNFTAMDYLLRNNIEVTDGAHMHNAIPKQAMACTAQRFINTINPPPLSVQNNANVLPLSQYDSSTIMGSKMIRVQRGDWGWGDLGPKHAAQFIKKHYPCSRVVVNVRSNLKNQVSSINTTFVARRHVTNEYGLRSQTKFLLSLADELGGNHAKVIKLEKWSKDSRILNNLIEWIGFKGCGLDHILHNNQGSDGYEQDKRTETLFEASCHYPH